MSVITGKDIYQDDGTLQKLRDNIKYISEEARKIKIDLAGSNSSNAKGREEINALNNEINKLVENYKKQNITLKQLEDSIKNEMQATNADREAQQALNQIKKEANTISKLTIQLNNSVEGSYKKISAQYALNVIALDKMSEAQQKNTEEGKKLQKETLALKEKMKLLKEAQGTNTLSVGNYKNSIIQALNEQKRLTAELSRTEQEWKRLPASIRNNTTAIEQHKAATQGLKGQIAELQAVTGQQVTANEKATGSFNNLWSSLKNLLAVYLSISGIKALGQQILGQTTQLDSLNLAYEKTIPNAQKLAETNDFLQRMSEDYGIEILGLREAYLKYNAAVQTSNLTSVQQRQIFESVSKATSILGLSGDKVKYVFMAIEQMMSKGKVSSEELRRQLGESLPGSMTIMADALGVSTLKLDEMLKKGEVMSEDALPKFAAQLEKAYGIEGVTKIDNLASAQGRFKTAITEVIEKLDSADFFKNFFKSLTTGLKFIGDNINAILNLGKAIILLGVAYGTWKTSMAITTGLQKIGIATTLADTAAKTGLNVVTLLLTRSMNALKLAFLSNPIGFVATAALTAYSAFALFNKEVNQSSKVMKDLETTTKQRLVNNKVEIESLLKVANDETRSLEERKKAIEKLNGISPEYLGNLNLQNAATKEGKLLIDDYIASLETQIRYEAAKESLIELEKQHIEAQNKGVEESVTFWQKAGNAFLAMGDAAKYNYLNIASGAKNAAKAENDYIKSREKLLQIVSKPINEPKKSKSTITDTGIGAGTKPEKIDPFADDELRIAAMEEGYFKELALLRLNFEKKKIEFEKYGVDVTILEEQYWRERIGINVKYLKKQQEENDKAEREKISLLPEGLEKQQAQLDLEYQIKLRSVNDKIALEKWYEREKAKLIQENNEKLYSKELSDYDSLQGYIKQEFDLVKSSEKQKTIFRLTAERDRWVKILELNAKYGSDLTQQQITIIQNMIKTLNAEIEGTQKNNKNIYELLGFNFNDDQKQIIKESFQQATQWIQDYYNKQKEIADNLVQLRQKETDQALQKLQIERDAQAAGYHNNVAQAEKDLKLAEKRQKDSIALQRKAQKEQILINAALQASNMITGTAKIWSAFAAQPYIAIPLIAIMWGSFIASQAKALSLTKKNKKGTYQTIGNGSHWTDNDTFIGRNNGVDNYAESGEGMAVFNRGAVSKYGNLIPKQVELFNTGKYPLNFQRDIKINRNQSSATPNIIVKNAEKKADLYLVPANGEKYVLIDEKGHVKKSLTVIG